MVSWLVEIERREAAARAEISELRSRLEELAGRLAEWEAVLSRQEITRATMTEILSGEGAVTVSVDEAAEEVHSKKRTTLSTAGREPGWNTPCRG